MALISRPIVTMPDAELETVLYLGPLIAAATEAYVIGATIGTRVPNPVPAPFVRVRRVGGVSSTVVVDRARLDLQIWHEHDDDRMNLALWCQARLHAWRGTRDTVACCRVEDVLSPIQVPDPLDASRSVVLLTVQATLRAAPIA